MNLSVSDLLLFLRCPYAAHAAWTHGVAAPTPAMRRGTAIHKALEHHLKGQPIPADLIDAVADADRKFTEASIFRLADWKPSFTVDATEHPLSYTYSDRDADLNFTIVGRLDALVTDSAGAWSLQLKTLGKGKNLGLTMEKVRMSPHEIVYHWLAEQAGIKLRGTKLLLLKDLTIAEKAAGTDMLTLVDLPRTYDDVVAAFGQDIQPNFEALADMLHYGPGYRNWTSCYGDFGNSPCTYYEHCHNGLPLPILPLTPKEDRYADLTAEA